MSLEPPTTLSPSKMSAFKHCPLQFRFSVIDRLPEPPSPAASKGTLVHRALELLMLRPPAERTLAVALAGLDRARAELADDPEFAGLELDADQVDAFHADARALVARYFEIEDPAAVRPIGLELRLSVTLGSLTLRGIIDRLELDGDGELVVTDYKTGSVPSERAEQDRLGGVHFYSLLCDRLFGRRPARIQLLYLSKPEVLSICPSEQSVTGMERRAVALWAAVERACARDDFRPNRSRLCDWCNFQAYCPAWGGDPEQAAALRPEPVLLPA
ncbi:MAG TPA: PD-(D/E)XK nuclease family protein [Acidimicrobiia bacterium]|jgi:putative RecB family exonuclease|nr:PD-(D/E)XK nuclease family protein [Acidimicrobiia bacterium]